MQSQDLILAKARGKILELINPWQNQCKWLCFNSIHKPPALPVRIEKIQPLPGDHGLLI